VSAFAAHGLRGFFFWFELYLPTAMGVCIATTTTRATPRTIPLGRKVIAFIIRENIAMGGGSVKGELRITN